MKNAIQTVATICLCILTSVSSSGQSPLPKIPGVQGFPSNIRSRNEAELIKSANQFMAKREQDRIKRLADYGLTNNTTTITVKPNGTYTSDDVQRYEIYNEKGRLKFAQERVFYQSETTKTKILEAKTINGTESVLVDPKTILDNRVANGEVGMMNMHELIIPFTHLKEGSIVEYKTHSENFATPLPGIFSMRFMYGIQLPEFESITKVVSPQKLSYSVFDPNHQLKIVEGRQGASYTLEVELLRPAYFKIAGSDNFAEDSVPRVDVSSAKSWQDVVAPLQKRYEAAISSPLPEELRTIVANAKSKKSELEQIDSVTAQLSKIMTYSGNWLTLNKMIFPKGHKAVVLTHTGDCKDFSTTATAVLRALGFKADVALVYRDANFFKPTHLIRPVGDPDKSLPMLDYTNHAIVRVELKDKRVIWVDPTTTASMAGYANPDIAGSPAIVLNPQTNRIEHIPFNTPGNAQIKSEKTVLINAEGKSEGSGWIIFEGYSAVSMRTIGMQLAKDKLDEIFTVIFTNGTKTKQKDIKPVDLSQRDASPLKVEISFEAEPLVQTNEKGSMAILPLSPSLNTLGQVMAKDRDFFYLNEPTSSTSVTHFKGWIPSDEMEGECLALGDFGEVRRRVKITPDGFDINDEVKFLKTHVDAKKMQENELRDLRQFVGAVQDCASTQYLKVTKRDDKAPKPSMDEKIDLDQLLSSVQYNGPGIYNKAMRARRLAQASLSQNKTAKAYTIVSIATLFLGYQSGNRFVSAYARAAIDSANEAIAMDPKFAMGYIAKARAMIPLGDTSGAVKAFTIGYQLDPKSLPALVTGYKLSMAMKNPGYAENYLLNGVSVAKTPDEKCVVYAALGGFYQDTKNLAKAEKSYQQALSFNPNDAWVYNNLGIVYSDSKQFDKAIEHYQKAIKEHVGVATSSLAFTYAAKANSIIEAEVKTPAQKLDEAENLSHEALKISENNTDALEALSKVYYFRAVQKKDRALLNKSSEYMMRLAPLLAEQDSGRVLSKFSNRMIEFENVMRNVASTTSAGEPKGVAADKKN